MLSPALFRSRSFIAANGVSFFMYASLFGVLFLMMQFLQIGLGYSPLGAGVRTLPWTGAPMIVAPIAGALADRYGNRPFMIVGLTMQAIGLGWIAAIAQPGMGYTQLAVALGVAGVGISLCFPTVANAVVGSVPPEDMGIASGTNSSIREVGGVFGIAILAAIFANSGVYTSSAIFIDHFKHAVWVGAALSAIGIIAAVALPRRTQLEAVSRTAYTWSRNRGRAVVKIFCAIGTRMVQSATTETNPKEMQYDHARNWKHPCWQHRSRPAAFLVQGRLRP